MSANRIVNVGHSCPCRRAVALRRKLEGQRELLEALLGENEARLEFCVPKVSTLSAEPHRGLMWWSMLMAEALDVPQDVDAAAFVAAELRRMAGLLLDAADRLAPEAEEGGAA